MNFLVIVIAISLSMDAFSLSLAYGTLSLNKNDINILSSIVGVYHFIMPLIGLFLGNRILKIIPINSNLIVFIVLFFIGIQMIVETFKEDDNIVKMKLMEMIIFGFAVSIDAFSVGVGLEGLCSHYLLTAIIFSITSFIFTYLGLKLGNKISKLIGKLSTIFGGVTLIVIAILYIV